jgi:bacterioferritin-associated ferredoxin
MYICICHGITDRDIRSRIHAGASDVSTLRAELGCGATCGSCLSEVERMLEETRSAAAARPLGVPVLQLA